MGLTSDIYRTLITAKAINQEASKPLLSMENLHINISQVNDLIEQMNPLLPDKSVMDTMWHDLCQIPDECIKLRPLLGCTFQELSSQGKVVRKVLLRMTRKKLVVFELIDKIAVNAQRSGGQVVFLHSVPYELINFKIYSERRYIIKIYFASGHSFYYKMLQHPIRPTMWGYWKKYLLRSCKMRKPERLLPTIVLPTIKEEDEEETLPASRRRRRCEKNLFHKLLPLGPSHTLTARMKAYWRAFREDKISHSNGRESSEHRRAKIRSNPLTWVYGLRSSDKQKATKKARVQHSSFYKTFFTDKYLSVTT